jgi:AbrB family looped-hinge helix DNA binding protein
MLGGDMLLQYMTTLVLDDKGRIVIPQKVRDLLELKRGSTLILKCEMNQITLESGEKENEY